MNTVPDRWCGFRHVTSLYRLSHNSCHLALSVLFLLSKLLNSSSVRLKLLDSIKVHPAFHVSLLKAVISSDLSPPAFTPAPPIRWIGRGTVRTRGGEFLRVSSWMRVSLDTFILRTRTSQVVSQEAFLERGWGYCRDSVFVRLFLWDFQFLGWLFAFTFTLAEAAFLPSRR